MTLILAARGAEGDAILAGDRYLGEPTSPIFDLLAVPKISQVFGGEAWFGYAGDPTNMDQLIELMAGHSGTLSLFTKIARKQMPEERPDISGLLVWGKDIYYMDEGYAWFQTSRPFAAIGIGRDFAMGSLAYAAKTGALSRNPLLAIQRTMALAASHSDGIKPPFDYSVD